MGRAPPTLILPDKRGGYLSRTGPYFLAVDLGSSRLRCIVTDARGNIVGQASSEVAPTAPADLAPLGRELSADTLWTVLGRLVRRSMREAGIRGADVAAASATSQREGIVLLDGEGRELYAGPNTDLRAFMEGQSIDEEHQDKVYNTTGHLPSFLFAPAKLQWHKNNRPGLLERVRHVLSLDSWIAYRLCGVPAVERSSAAEIGLLNVADGEWATDLLSLLKLPTDILPPLTESGQVLGQVSTEAAAATGLSRQTRVVAGGPDTQCGLLGMGVTEPGQVGVVAGWSAPVQAVTDRLYLDDAMRTWSGRHLMGDRWVMESSATEAGGAYRWAATNLAVDGSEDRYAAIDRLARNAPPGSNAALAFLGPRTANMANVGPRWGGLLFPLLSDALPIGNADLFRATLENLSFAIKSNLAQIEKITGVAPSGVSFGGGMAKSRTLTRILANVLDCPLLLARSPEVTGLGAAICAAAGTDAYSGLRQAAGAMAKRGRLMPQDPILSIDYQDYYSRWLAMDEGLDALGDRL